MPFEVYGAENCPADYYRSGFSIETLREHVRASAEAEKEICFAFTLPSQTDGSRLHAFVRAPRVEGFFY